MDAGRASGAAILASGAPNAARQVAIHLRIIELLQDLEETEQLPNSLKPSKAIKKAQEILVDLLLAAGKADNEQLTTAIRKRLSLSTFALFGNPADTRTAIQVPIAVDADPELCRRIGEVIIEGLPPERPSLQHIIMTIRLGSNGTLQVSATDVDAEAAATVSTSGPTSPAQAAGERSTAQDEREHAAVQADDSQQQDAQSQAGHTGQQSPRYQGCPHVPQCPDPSSPDREAAQTIASHPEQGWSLLCNGIVIFEDMGELDTDTGTDTDIVVWRREKQQHISGTRWRDSSAS